MQNSQACLAALNRHNCSGGGVPSQSDCCLQRRKEPVGGFRRHPLIIRFSANATSKLGWQLCLNLCTAEEPPPRTPRERGASRYFSEFIFKITLQCRVLHGSEPAFAGRVPTRQISLGLRLSHPCREIGSLIVGVGSERRCSIASTAGQLFLYHKVQEAHRESLIRYRPMF